MDLTDLHSLLTDPAMAAVAWDYCLENSVCLQTEVICHPEPWIGLSGNRLVGYSYSNSQRSAKSGGVFSLVYFFGTSKNQCYGIHGSEVLIRINSNRRWMAK